MNDDKNKCIMTGGLKVDKRAFGLASGVGGMKNVARRAQDVR